MDRTTESVYLRELASVLDVALWRASEIEACLRELKTTDVVRDFVLDPPYWARVASGRTRVLGAIEGFLAAFARASLILYPARKAHSQRGAHLRAALGRDHLAVDAFSDRGLRDGWMHLDEDIGLMSENHSGAIEPTTLVSAEGRWYTEAQHGSVRIVDPSTVAVALPRRGIWALRPYFHACADLRKYVEVALTNPYRWECVGDVSGLAVGWSGKPEAWMIKALNYGCPVVVSASSYKDVVRAFHEAVAHWKRHQQEL